MNAHLCSLNSLDYSATISIDGTRYEYFFHQPDMLRKVEFLFKIGAGKGVNFAKRKAVRVRKLEELA